MKHYILLVLIALTFCSCDPLTQKNKKLITGEWTFLYHIHDSTHKIIIEDTFQFANFTSGYKFYNNGNCDNKAGYFDYERKATRDSSKTIYLGNKTHYKLNGNKLSIFDIIRKQDDDFIIDKLTADSLILLRDSCYFKYAKTKYHDDGKPLFDEIIISSSGCYGFCPINYMSLKRTGEFIFDGIKYNTINQAFSAIISKAKFDSIELAFKKSTPLKLQNEYDGGMSDMSTTEVAFIKNGKIIKKISDYAYDSPVEFQNAYRPLQYLYQQIKNKTQLPDDAYRYFTPVFWVSNKREVILSPTEWFYLANQLRTSPVSNKILNAKVNYQFPNDIPTEYSVTDGRIFTSFSKSRNPVSYDLGYNFFEHNAKFIKME